MNRLPPTIGIDRLLASYEAILLDAYGVLITHDGPMPGARSLVDRLNREEKPYLILTNDASRSPEASAERYRDMGLEIAGDRVLTSGLLILPHLREHDLEGARCVVMGTGDSVAYVSRGDVRVVDLDAATEAEVLVVCDERGYPLRESLDHVLSLLYRRLDRGDPVHLVLANPDLVYPAAPGRYGFTAGIVAYMLEEALGLRYGAEAPRFEPLGKPHPPMFEAAARCAGTRDLVMVGDQLGTDIRGANAFGIDSVLVPTGVTRLDRLGSDPACRPTYILESLEPGGKAS